MNQSINTDSKNSKEPQQKYRLGTVSIKILGGLNRFYGRPTSPSASIMAQNIQPSYEQQLLQVFKSYVETYENLERNSIYKKVMQTTKRYRDEDDVDFDESIRKAIRKRRHLLEMKLEEYNESSLSSEENDEETDNEQGEDAKLPKKKQRKKRHWETLFKNIFV